ncbi:SDR family NAD(P)-dependent oxidoreductase [Ancylobacter polymorphus]|uniref:NAD(P)-dependent dehydrogenase (Short-subunit alcohol dehydrogenase family) n=1 Tax=Ancylobacter polymorphus TaxID=223390 RepID=A0ABU0BCL8_9HYPH|nr:SDR family NAD(P)-dependent oxidoreductase [Ancylobacter polymorphus]MDQ0303364.1 NAD(P)-dependent dehydrogenase (short-subunit alcohol dehydrogenase family) [Ancylobacter polymorphus]
MSRAVVIGASGGIGSALMQALRQQGAFDAVIGLSRRSTPALDLCAEASIAQAAAQVAAHGAPTLIIDATGMLSDATLQPEKALKALDPAAMARAFAINAIGPALLMKHFLPLLPRDAPAVFATLSAKVGSIGDNRLGGWYSYRASKAALNQLVRTAAIELARTHRQAVCVALHPGTVETPLSRPFAKVGLEPLPPETAARELLAGLARLGPADSGGFFDRHGAPLPF